MTTSRTRRWVEMQGYVGLDDARVIETDRWSRLAPALCMVWVAAGTWLRSPTFLWILMPIAALGAVLPWRPFDLLYNHGLRYPVGGRSLPPSGIPRRFACSIATLWIGAIGWAFHSGATTLGYWLGASMVLAASSATFLGFCIPSFIYRRAYGRCGGQ